MVTKTHKTFWRAGTKDPKLQVSVNCCVEAAAPHKISLAAIQAVSPLGKGEMWGGSYCNVLVQSSNCSWVGARSLLKLMGTSALHTNLTLDSVVGLVLFHYRHLGAISAPRSCVRGTTGTALWRCLLSVCRERGNQTIQGAAVQEQKGMASGQTFG